jgi:hypothetical protein
MNQLMTRLFIEQPLASPGSAKKEYGALYNILVVWVIKGLISNSSCRPIFNVTSEGCVQGRIDS